MSENQQDTASCLRNELDWLSVILDLRMHSYFEDRPFDITTVPAPEHPPGSQYDRLISLLEADAYDRVILAMALVPHLAPQIFDRFFIQNKSIGRAFSEFGGAEAPHHRGFFPTGETVCFVLSGRDLTTRVQVQRHFSDRHPFRVFNVLWLQPAAVPDTFWSGKLTISEEWLSRLTTGEEWEPQKNSSFPAARLETGLGMSDLVLNPKVMEEVRHIRTWMAHQEEIRHNPALSRTFKKGYRALFYGPPGTGKTLTVSVLGREHHRPVYRIDLSQLVSKYIGETEKNLSTVFRMAEHKEWILFFDEAESLFSKRTEVSDAKDRYANQETSYLLQRIEQFDGLVILATNLKPNIDRAFIRRFQSIVHFAMPDAREREMIWKGQLSAYTLAPDVNIRSIASDFEVSGGAITNAVQFAWLNARGRNASLVHHEDIVHGVIRELGKEGKTSKI
jgi:DNA polymerase III delta prime subunit